MSDRSVTHATFVIERRYPADRARVFKAWADPKAKALWFGAPEGHGVGRVVVAQQLSQTRARPRVPADELLNAVVDFAHNAPR